MTRKYVFVDVETTGFSAQSSEIIEVAAVAWQDSEIIETVASLVRPKGAIPYEITQLTGITDDMVAKAPAITTLNGRLRKIIGDNVVVGHNVSFDLGFLREQTLAIGNHRLDTVTLASILLPEAGRFSLEHLVTHLKLPETTAHRAEADTLHTLDLFVHLWNVALELDKTLLMEIIEAGRSIGWPETLFFEEVFEMRVQKAFTEEAAPESGLQRMGKLFRVPKLEGQALNPVYEDEDEVPIETAPVDVDMVAEMLTEGSNFSRAFPNFEPRQQQIDMLKAVGRALSFQDDLLVEAGTGTGKSLAYLLPAAFWATENQRRVVISTNTINLQDQLIGKDIPALQKTLPFKVNVAVRKGKSNYVCPRLFHQLRRRGPKDKDEMALYARILLWLGRTKTGDVSEISLRGPAERIAWRRLSGENAPCSPRDCSAENCPLHQVRRKSEMAHIVIVNHSLLLADANSENHILPSFRDLIVDEAHHLEQAVTNGLSFEADKRFLEAILEEISSRKSGIISELEKAMKGLPDAIRDKMDEIIGQLRQAAVRAETYLADFFDTLTFFARDYIGKRTDFSQSLRLLPAIRQQADWDNVVASWGNLNTLLKQLAKGVGRLAEGVGEILMHEADFGGSEEMQLDLARNAKSLEETRENLDDIVANPIEGYIYWVDIWRERISLHAAPLHVGPLVERHIFDKLDAVVLTSATMRTAPTGRQTDANFDYIQDRLHATKAKKLAVGSPFNYKKSTLLYLCSDIPEPKQPGYQQYVEKAIIDVAKACKGRTMVLFTSYKQLKETAQAIQGPLADTDIEILAQFKGSSRQRLTDQFKREGAKAILLGTKSFWEGVDVPGPALEAVIIVKLPFDVPTDPVHAARSETFNNSFMEYTMPEAVLKFRQGFGRLIRRKSDEGIVIVLDKRVLTKRYGELFINALPECTLLRQRTERLPEIIERWHKRDRSK